MIIQIIDKIMQTLVPLLKNKKLINLLFFSVVQQDSIEGVHLRYTVNINGQYIDGESNYFY